MSPLVLSHFLGRPNPVRVNLARKAAYMKTDQGSFCGVRPVASLPACVCHIHEVV